MLKTALNFIEDKVNEVRGSAIDNFKRKRSFVKRLEESNRIISKYPERIPLIVCRATTCKDVPDIDRHKYLVPRDLSIGQFMHVIRQRIKLEPHISIYLMINDFIMPATSQLLGVIYNEHSDDDGFMYITYTGESTFG
tara:strand:+ start:40 stop:453 length:414 start_codon:yes stop_codon:yes gene_type:complete